jgi:hypothetical protein
MPRSIYRKIDGVYQWVHFDKEPPKEGVAPAVHQDTLAQPLRHMVTGEITDSRSRLEQLNRQTGVTCVGTEKLSEKRHSVPDRLTDDRILDGVERALAVSSDPSKLRARVHENQERMERVRKYLNAH